MNSADAWHPANAWPNDPNGSLVPILEASVEDAKRRHPSGKDLSCNAEKPAVVLTAADRCDGCGAGALYRVQLPIGHPDDHPTFDFCHHHKGRLLPALEAKGWKVIGQNPTLMAELYDSNRLKGEDHG